MSIPTDAPLPAAQPQPAYAPYTQQGEHPRKAPLSGRARALTITIIVCNALLSIVGLAFHSPSFADIAAYMTVITLAVIYLIKKTAATRYALAGVSVIILFVAFPILAACLGGHYVYLTFIGGRDSRIRHRAWDRWAPFHHRCCPRRSRHSHVATMRDRPTTPRQGTPQQHGDTDSPQCANSLRRTDRSFERVGYRCEYRPHHGSWRQSIRARAGQPRTGEYAVRLRLCSFPCRAD